MKVLVIGSGGREHAIVWKLSCSPLVDKLYCAPGNAGIAEHAECVNIGVCDVEAMTRFALEMGIEFVVIGPEAPLTVGMADAFEGIGIPVFGPRKNAAIIESSKAYSKLLMRKYGIPTADFEIFDNSEKAAAYIRSRTNPLVVKADGLAAGKGVIVAADQEEAIAAAESMLNERTFGDAGNMVIVEDRLYGQEVSVLCFTDGESLMVMPSSKDHKQAFDGGRGPNTGGMGAISPSRDYTPADQQFCMQKIFQPTVDALKAEGRPFKGIIYFGLMLTANGPKLLEYNARFGDPECQAILSRLNSDLMEIMIAVANGTLNQVAADWSTDAACCVVLASGGYPGEYTKGLPISGLDNEEVSVYARVFHSGTSLGGDGGYVTNGGRVLGVTATGATLDTAIVKAYYAAGKISFPGMFLRRDIGKI